QEVALGVEQLHVVIEVIGDQHRPVGGDGDAHRPVKFAVASAWSAPAAQHRAGAVEDLHAIGVVVAEVEEPLGINRHTGREGELPWTGALRAPGAQVVAAGVEMLHAAAGVSDVDTAVAVDRQRTGEATRTYCSVPQR